MSQVFFMPREFQKFPVPRRPFSFLLILSATKLLDPEMKLAGRPCPLTPSEPLLVQEVDGNKQLGCASALYFLEKERRHSLGSHPLVTQVNLLLGFPMPLSFCVFHPAVLWEEPWLGLSQLAGGGD